MFSSIFAAITWNPDPILLKLGPLEIRWYGLLFASAILTGIIGMKKIFIKEGKNENHLDPLLWYLVAGIIIGARLGHCLFYEPSIYLKDPIEILKIWRGGLASHGGILGIFLALWLFCLKYKDYNYLWLLDRLTIPSAFGSGLIRMGNFFNSEIVGNVTEKPWGMIFPRVGPSPRHAVQLYEALVYFSLGIILVILYKKKNAKYQPGLMPGIFLTFAFIARFLIEFLKRRQSEFEMTISMGQWLSIPIVIFGLALLIFSLKKQVSQQLPDKI